MLILEKIGLRNPRFCVDPLKVILQKFTILTLIFLILKHIFIENTFDWDNKLTIIST